MKLLFAISLILIFGLISLYIRKFREHRYVIVLPLFLLVVLIAIVLQTETIFPAALFILMGIIFVIKEGKRIKDNKNPGMH